MKKLTCFFLSFFFVVIVNAQNSTGTLIGKIIDAESGSPLTGASIQLSKTIGKTTDVEGRFSFKVPVGIYTVQVAYVGYSPKTVTSVEVKVGEVNEINIPMTASSKQLTEVVVTSTSARRESVNAILAMQKNNTSISDGLSSEAIRKSPDRNVGEVLKRVSGTSVQDDKFVVVRGLSDRYNVATINGALLPSTEPDRRAFAFDIVPSNMIDNVLINKTASPDLPGDFSGGIVQVITKDIPFSKTFGLSIGTGYNTQSTGKPFNIGKTGSLDYLGFDDGTRAFPSRFPSSANRYKGLSREQQIVASQYMRNNYGNKNSLTAIPGLNLQLNWGNKFDLKNGGTIGAIAALTYRNSQNIQYNERLEYQIASTNTDYTYNYRDTTYSFTTNIGALINLAYKKGNTKIGFKNTLNRILDNTSLSREGYNYDNQQYVKASSGIFVQKTLISSQLEGEHKMSDKNDRLKWNANYAFTARNQPDYRVLPYAKNIDAIHEKGVPVSLVLRDTYRFWSDLFENSFGGKVDYSLPFKFRDNTSTFKAGAMSQYKVRDFKARVFRVNEGKVQGVPFNSALYTLSPETIFNRGNFYYNSNSQGFVYDDITNPNDRYDATSGLYAAYAMLDNKLSDALRVVWGVRVEKFDFNVNTANTSGQALEVKRDYLDILPSANVIYSIDKKNNIRFSASRTVSRPELREVANFPYFDFVRNAIITGNTNLERSQNTNIDLRYEMYPTAGEILSVSGFYKHFNNPIEQTIASGSTPTNLILTYQNPASATLYGVELDVRKRMSFLGDAAFLDNLTFNLNASVIKSSVKLDETFSNYDPNRPLQGQSPYLVNAGLTYSTPSKWSFTGLFNRIGQRIDAVGFQGYPDIYENARSVIDFQIGKRFAKDRAEFKLNVSDLLNQKAVFYQNYSNADKRAYAQSEDRVRYSYLYGTNVSVVFSYNFK